MALVDIVKLNNEYYIIESVRKMAECVGIHNVFQEYYEDIDEMVALPMVAFLEKGYITEMSCSGHSNYFLSSCYKNECHYEEESIFCIEEDGLEELFFLDRDYGEKRYFISFVKNYFKDVETPNGWKYEENKSIGNSVYDLYYEIGNKTGNELIVIQARLSQQLLEWIENLPSILRES